jgi:hypothetical protein
MPFISLSLFLFVCSVGFAFQAKIRPQAIYDHDTRQEYFELSENNKIKKQVRAVGGLIYTDNIKNDVQYPALAFLPDTKAKSRYKLCSSVRYADQPSSLFCSGFLVAPDVVVTAGHCIKNKISCDNLSFVFDYKADSAQALLPLNAVPANSVYKCKQILFSSDEDHSDISILRLERKVIDREPFALSLLKVGEPELPQVILAGHGLGLPLKVSQPEPIVSTDQTSFLSLVPAFIRNSGSPLIHSLSGEVLGLLVDGEEDFVQTTTGCRELKVCKGTTNCQGERALQIYPFVNLINQYR